MLTYPIPEDVAGEYVRLEDEANDAYEVHGEDENNGGEGENEADLDAELDDVIGGNEPDPDCASATEADLERVCEPDTDDGDASEEADLCEDAYEDLEKENSNSDEDSAPTHFEWDETNNMAESDLNVGLRFPNRESFKTALKDWAVKRGYDLKFVKNERRKVTVLCKYGCEWRLHASPVMRGIEWMIKSHTGAHTCAHHTTNSQADYKYLGKRIMEYVRDNPTEDQKAMHDIRMGYPKVGEDKTPYEWLCDIPAHQWARSHFPLTSKSDLLVNNLSECFNSYILPARDLPIIEMMEWIRKKCMSRIQKKREWMLNFDKEVCPNILKKVEAERIISGNCFPTWGGGSEFEVIHGEQTHVVRLDVRNCTCGKWQRVGYPCCHAIAALDLHRLDYNPYIDHVFSKEVYMRVYENHISPVPGMHDFEISPLGAVAPPHIRTRAGRPKKRRRPDGNDQNQRQTSTRRGLTVTCAICLQGGHNRRRCRSQPHPNSKFFKASSENAQVSTSMPGPENASGSAPITGFENASVSPQMPGTDAIPTQSSASTSNVSKRKADKAPGTALKRLCKPTTSSLLRGVQFATKPKGKALGPPKSKGN